MYVPANLPPSQLDIYVPQTNGKWLILVFRLPLAAERKPFFLVEGLLALLAQFVRLSLLELQNLVIFWDLIIL